MQNQAPEHTPQMPTPPQDPSMRHAPAGVPGRPPVQPKPKKPFYKKWWVWLLAVLVIIIAVQAGGDSEEDAAEASSEQQETSEGTENSGDDSEEAEDVAEDDAEENEAEPESVEEEPSFDSFDKIELAGTGDDVLTGVGLDDPAVATISCESCAANFQVETDGGLSDLLPVNAIGAYSGKKVLNMDNSGIDQITVTADSDWEIVIEDLNSLETYKKNTSSRGDGVFVYTGSEKAGTFMHDGEANFQVESYGKTMPLQINEIGTYEGSVPIESGVIAVTADGDWSFEAKK